MTTIRNASLWIFYAGSYGSFTVLFESLKSKWITWTEVCVGYVALHMVTDRQSIIGRSVHLFSRKDHVQLESSLHHTILEYHCCHILSFTFVDGNDSSRKRTFSFDTNGSPFDDSFDVWVSLLALQWHNPLQHLQVHSHSHHGSYLKINSSVMIARGTRWRHVRAKQNPAKKHSRPRW